MSILQFRGINCLSMKYDFVAADTVCTPETLPKQNLSYGSQYFFIGYIMYLFFPDVILLTRIRLSSLFALNCSNNEVSLYRGTDR